MKHAFYCLVFFMASIASACHTTRNMTTQDSIHRKWMLQTIDSVDNALVLKSKAFIDLPDSGRASAKAGCNGLGFGVKLTGNKGINFTPGPATMMYCAEFMAAENGLVAALKKVKSYSIKANKILFKDSTGNTLITGIAE